MHKLSAFSVGPTIDTTHVCDQTGAETSAWRNIYRLLPMQINRGYMIALLCSVGSIASLAEPPHIKCPVELNRVEVSYRHDGGQSKPQLQLDFENRSDLPVSNIVFRLVLLDSGGYSQEYAHTFIYTDIVQPGKAKVARWKLDADEVDIHRTGASATVEKLTYTDSSNWVDDGSESCSVTMDYHPR